MARPSRPDGVSGGAVTGLLTLCPNTSRDAAYLIGILEALEELAPVSKTTILQAALAGAAFDKEPADRQAAARVVLGIKSVHSEATRPAPPRS